MKTALVIWGLTLAFSAGAALPPGSLATVRSRSNQFRVTGPLPGAAPTSSVDPKSTEGRMRLEPATLVVSCEKVKEALLHALDARDQWQGGISLILRPMTEQDSRITVTSMLAPNGWSYQVNLPDWVRQDQLFEVLVRVLLQEMAGRHSGPKPAELPAWLVEGMVAHLRATAQVPLLLEPERFWTTPKVARSYRLPDPLQAVREQLRAQPALSYAELGQPNTQAPERRGLFQSCAHLFLSELLSLPEGPAGMREMLRLLPQHLNWQFAFLRAYQPRFKSALDVEKWWSVTVVNFLGRDRHAKWPIEMGLQRLDGILRATVEIHLSTNALPQRQEMRLQAFLEQVDYARQRPTLQTIVSQLKMLEWSVPTDLLKLVDDYRFALESYLARRDGLIGPAATGGGSRPAAYPLVRATIKQLDLLDILRGDFKKYGTTPMAASSDRPKQQP